MKKLIDKFLITEDTKWKTIEEVAVEIFKGNGVTKVQVGSGDFPCIRYGEIYTKYDIFIEKCLSKTNEKLIKFPRFVEYGDIIVTDASETLEDIGKSCAYLDKSKAIVGLHTIVVRHNQNPKYLSYALSSNQVKKQLSKLAVPGIVIGLSVANFKKLKIPLPSLEIQERIVRILDSLRLSKKELIKKLKEEINNREEQYKYYRDQIIFRGGVESYEATSKCPMKSDSKTS